MKRLRVFVTRLDILPVLLGVEQAYPLSYVRTGRSVAAECVVLQFAGDIPDLGLADRESGISCASYLAVRRGSPVCARALSTDDDIFLIDQLNNPDSVIVRPAGVWNERVMVYGGFETAYDGADSAKADEFICGVFEEKFCKVTFVLCRWRSVLLSQEWHEVDDRRAIARRIRSGCALIPHNG